MGESLIAIENKLYFRTGGAVGDALSAATFATNFTLVAKAKNVRVGLQWGEGDLSSRASRFSAKKPTLGDWTLEFDTTWKPDDTVLEAIQDACYLRTEVEFVLADGPSAPVATEKVRRAGGYIFSDDDDQQLTEGETKAWTFMPGENLPPERIAMPS